MITQIILANEPAVHRGLYTHSNGVAGPPRKEFSNDAHLHCPGLASIFSLRYDITMWPLSIKKGMAV